MDVVCVAIQGFVHLAPGRCLWFGWLLLTSIATVGLFYLIFSGWQPPED